MNASLERFGSFGGRKRLPAGGSLAQSLKIHVDVNKICYNSSFNILFMSRKALGNRACNLRYCLTPLTNWATFCTWGSEPIPRDTKDPKLISVDGLESGPRTSVVCHCTSQRVELCGKTKKPSTKPGGSVKTALSRSLQTVWAVWPVLPYPHAP